MYSAFLKSKCASDIDKAIKNKHMTFEEVCAKFHIGDLVAADLMDKLNLLYHRGYLQIYGGDRINELNFKL